jgi:NTP pyrophosphatase (non-canonical NTP hydrolase)
VNELRALQKEIHQTAKEHGWWDKPREDGTLIALMHSELSEALEALRQGNPMDDKLPGFFSATVELADVIIRILDFAEWHDYDVIGAMKAKAEFNKSRPYRHGGKAC